MDGSVGSADIKIDLSDRQPKTLVELLHDGFYLLFMLRRRNNPKDAALFRSSIQMMLTEFEKNAKKLRISAEDVHSAKYAFCALVDEIVLSSHINPLDVLLRQKTRFVAGQFARQYRPVQIGRALHDLACEGTLQLVAETVAEKAQRKRSIGTASGSGSSIEVL